jgi:hypothetical protein
MPFNWFDIWIERGYPLKHRLGVTYSSKDGGICQKCISKRIDAALDSPYFDIYQEREYYNVSDVCEVCEQKKPAYRAIKMSNKIIDDVRFCTKGSWNGHYVCIDCVKIALEYGEPKSSFYGYYKEKSVPINGYGLPVVDGKVRFPQ